jgi:hypothetical protein
MMACLCVDARATSQCLLALPGGGLVVSAGGNHLKVWDVLTGRALAGMACCGEYAYEM